MVLKNLIVLPDGTEISSGAGARVALQNVTLTQSVNAGQELTLGSVCSNMLEVTLLAEGGFSIAAGTEVTLYKVDDNDNRTKIGLFTTEKPARPSANVCKLTAYDRVSWLDKELSQWLANLNGWPYSLYDFAKMVCSVCNLTLANQSLPNGDWQVQKFAAEGITGRQLMQWVGQACGRFCRATADGQLEFAWYTPKDIAIASDGAYPIFALQFADYETAPIDKVQIQLTGTDVGAVYGTGSNAYCVTGNYLLCTDTLEPLQAVAEELYNTLQAVTYTPCKVSIPVNTVIQPGDILHVTDTNGKVFPMYIMTKVQTGQLEMLECVGSARRDSTTAANNTGYTALHGKVLQMQMSMEGVKAENRDASGRVSLLEMTVDGLVANVSDRQADLQDIMQRVTAVEQTAAGVSVQVQSMADNGVSKVETTTGYTFDETGMTVEKSGTQIKTQITEDGMTVYKSANAVLTANSQGVDAVDLHASTYLIVGGRSRFENYEADRTGCFWVGG